MATAIEMITRAMRLAGVLRKNTQPDDDEAADGLTSLNAMLESWTIERLFVPYIVDEALTLVAGDGSYTMGPSGDLNTTTPTRIDPSCTIRLNDLDYPLMMVDQTAWSGITAKTTVQSSIPLYLFADMQFPLVVLNFWPVPSQAAECRVKSWKQLQTFSDLTTALSIGKGYQRAIEYSLAEEFGPEFDVDVPAGVRVIAQRARKNIKRINTVTPVLATEAGLMTGRTFGSNIYADLPG